MAVSVNICTIAGMNTVSGTKKRKEVFLADSELQSLEAGAAKREWSLKKYMEHVLRVQATKDQKLVIKPFIEDSHD